MDLFRALKVFVHVIDDGSFAAAARELDLAPAVVTRLVADLEEHLDARLINRTTRRLSLTDVGVAYLERARQILAEVDEAGALANSSSANPRGPLRVLVGAAIAVHQLAKSLPEFHRRYPQVTLELHSPAMVDTMDDSFDISIIATRRELQGDFVARRLAQVEMIMCAAPSYLDARGRPSHPSELTGHDAILPPASALPDGIVLRRTNIRDDRPDDETFELMRNRKPLLSASHSDINLAAAKAGLGLTGLPSFLIKDELRNRELERVLPEWRLPCLTIWAAMPTRKYVPARTRAFLDFLVEIFGDKGLAGMPAGASCTFTPPKVARTAASAA